MQDAGQRLFEIFWNEAAFVLEFVPSVRRKWFNVRREELQNSSQSPIASTGERRSGASKSGFASAGNVAPPPDFPARRFTQTQVKPRALAGAMSW